MSAGAADDRPVAVRLPDQLPVLTPEASRILLTMLIELTEIEVLDEPPTKGSHDC